MHSKPLFQTALRLRAPASLEIFPASWSTSYVTANSTQEWGNLGQVPQIIQASGDRRHGMCSSSSSADGLSSILEGHVHRTKKPARHPGFGGDKRGGNAGFGAHQSGGQNQHRQQGGPNHYTQQGPGGSPGYVQQQNRYPTGHQQGQVAPAQKQAGRGRGVVVVSNQQNNSGERVPGMPPPGMPSQGPGQWQPQAPNQHQHYQNFNGVAPPYGQNPWNAGAPGMGGPPPPNWNGNRYAPNGSGGGHGFGNQPPNVMAHPVGFQPGHQNLPPNMMPPPNGQIPPGPDGQPRNGPGFMNVQNPGQPPQPFWKVETEDSGPPGGQYDSRWAKKFEQKFGGGSQLPVPPQPGMFIPPQIQFPHPHRPSTPRKQSTGEIELPDDITVKQLAQKLGVAIEKLEDVLSEVGEQPQSQEDRVSFDAAELAAAEFDKLVIRSKFTRVCESSVPRPAVVTVMGHVDHGKTTLLDSLRQTAVAAGEAGGITQHIGAFEVVMPDSKNSLTFLDTPGHAAFSAMRARGARVTDIVVLVVAADDGVMPQTREALRHIKEAGCPCVVAITKIDVPQANVEKVKQRLLSEGVELEEYGGLIQAIEVAAPTGVGLQELEESLMLQADMMELKAPLEGTVDAVVVEAHMDKGLGPVATIIVKRGTLKVGSSVVVGSQWGRVRVMKNAEGTSLNTVLPGKPAEICGLRGVPHAGDELMVVCDDERAKRLSDARSSRQVIKHWQAIMSGQLGTNGAGTDAQPGERPSVNFVLKADTKGTAEAIKDAIMGLSGDVVSIQVVHSGIGSVCEADIMFAAATKARILAFNLKTSPVEVQNIAQEHDISVHQHSIIYRLLDDVGAIMSDIAPLFEEEVVHGVASVLQVFELKGKRNKTGSVVAGCKVLDGHLQKSGGSIRVKRGDEVVHIGGCASLKRHKLDVERVGKGTEFGAVLDGFTTFQQGDVLQYLIVEKRKPKTEPVTGGGLRILPEPSARKEASN